MDSHIGAFPLLNPLYGPEPDWVNKMSHLSLLIVNASLAFPASLASAAAHFGVLVSIVFVY